MPKVIGILVKFRDRFVLLVLQKQRNLKKTSIMKVAKNLIIVAIFSMGLFTSCTPESIEDGQNPQQITPPEIPRQG
jgi:hypothetical protein|tara:strand:+ start:361 stop:588 length:228 start_codon:yes stop_codon:yes gene_type:complete